MIIKSLATSSGFWRKGRAGLVQLMEVPITKFPDQKTDQSEDDDDNVDEKNENADHTKDVTTAR